jgi:chaperonin GroEL
MKVARFALENAVSIASMLLSTEAIIAEAPQEEKAAAMPNPHMDY